MNFKQNFDYFIDEAPYSEVVEHIGELGEWDFDEFHNFLVYNVKVIANNKLVFVYVTCGEEFRNALRRSYRTKENDRKINFVRKFFAFALVNHLINNRFMLALTYIERATERDEIEVEHINFVIKRSLLYGPCSIPDEKLPEVFRCIRGLQEFSDECELYFFSSLLNSQNVEGFVKLLLHLFEDFNGKMNEFYLYMEKILTFHFNLHHEYYNRKKLTNFIKTSEKIFDALKIDITLAMPKFANLFLMNTIARPRFDGEFDDDQIENKYIERAKIFFNMKGLKPLFDKLIIISPRINTVIVCKLAEYGSIFKNSRKYFKFYSLFMKNITQLNTNVEFYGRYAEEHGLNFVGVRN